MSNRKRPLGAQVRALARGGMPDKTVQLLFWAAGSIGFVYVTLVIVTVYFATWQTALAASVRETEGTITLLETTYYSSVAQLSSTNPMTLGYVIPTEVQYAEARANGLSYARN